MKANELRIGNYLNFFDKAFVKIVSIRKDNTYYIESKKEHTTYYHVIDAYEPIPLTEEWLLKFGFEKHLNIFINKQGWCIYFENGILRWQSVILEHVHQLQNLYFALTGEELTTQENLK